MLLAPTGELYELLCHRKERERKEKRIPQNECFWNNSDPVHLIWTKFGMDIQLDPRNKTDEEFFLKSKMAAAVKGAKTAKFDPTNHISAQQLDPVHLI